MRIFLSIIAISFTLIAFSQTETRLKTPTNSEQAQNIITKGDDYFFVGNFKRALPLFKEAEKLDSNNAILNFKIGVCLIKMGKEKESLPFISKAKELNPKVDPKVDYALGLAYQDQQEYQKAIDSYNSYKKSLSNHKLELERTIVDAQILECEKALSNQINANNRVQKSSGQIAIKKQKLLKKQKGIITYRIQIISASEPLTSSQVSGIYSGPLEVYHQKVGNTYKYFIGDFTSKKEANRARSLSGVEGAFIVRFKDGKKVEIL